MKSEDEQDMRTWVQLFSEAREVTSTEEHAAQGLQKRGWMSKQGALNDANLRARARLLRSFCRRKNARVAEAHVPPARQHAVLLQEPAGHGSCRCDSALQLHRGGHQDGDKKLCLSNQHSVCIIHARISIGSSTPPLLLTNAIFFFSYRNYYLSVETQQEYDDWREMIGNAKQLSDEATATEDMKLFLRLSEALSAFEQAKAT